MNTSTPETAQEAACRLSAPMLDKGFKPVALHTYTDVDGNPIFYRIRCKHPETLEKWIRPIHENGNGFEMGEPKFQNGKPLYALHRIANNPEAIVWITEGEQKVNALKKLGLVATTSGGATSADTTDWEPLRGKTIKIFPDNDAAGKAYAETVASILLSMAWRRYFGFSYAALWTGIYCGSEAIGCVEDCMNTSTPETAKEAAYEKPKYS